MQVPPKNHMVNIQYSYLLEKKRLVLVLPPHLYKQNYSNLDNLDLIQNLKQLEQDKYDGLVAYNISAEEKEQAFKIPVLFLNDNEK